MWKFAFQIDFGETKTRLAATQYEKGPGLAHFSDVEVRIGDLASDQAVRNPASNPVCGTIRYSVDPMGTVICKQLMSGRYLTTQKPGAHLRIHEIYVFRKL